MTQENMSDTTEDVQADAVEQGTPDTEAAPVLNRAQRRAQARGKSGTGGAANSATHPSGAGGVGNRTGGHAGQVRFPRTGHK